MKHRAHGLKVLLSILAVLAVVMAGPIGTGSVAVAAEAAQGKQSQLERDIDALPAGQRAQLERQMATLLDGAGVDLSDPKLRAELAHVLGVEPIEIARSIDQVNAGAGAGEATPSQPILFLFIAAALVFAPLVFKSIAGTLYEIFSAGAIEGIEGLGG